MTLADLTSKAVLDLPCGIKGHTIGCELTVGDVEIAVACGPIKEDRSSSLSRMQNIMSCTAAAVNAWMQRAQGCSPRVTWHTQSAYVPPAKYVSTHQPCTHPEGI